VLSLLLVLQGDLVIITFCNKLERISLSGKTKKILREKKEKSYKLITLGLCYNSFYFSTTVGKIG
jgi:hypothetical protein